jgi:hypothetical protein
MSYTIRDEATPTSFAKDPLGILQKHRTHVTWDLNSAVLEAFRHSYSEERKADAEAAAEADVEAAAEVPEADSGQEEVLEAQGINENELIPIMEDMSRVEYYSCSNDNWINGTLHKNVASERKNKSSTPQPRFLTR